MKKVFEIHKIFFDKSLKIVSLALIKILIFSDVIAQSPPAAFNYSGVARDFAGQPIVSSVISIKAIIIKSTNWSAQYDEIHTVVTDNLGIFNLTIGSGLVQNGSISNINWGNDNYYLAIGIDVNGGSNFVIVSTTKILSVPYAFHAKTAKRISGAPNIGGFSHYIGEHYGGGVIFHLWKDAQGVEHGLIVDPLSLGVESWCYLTQANILIGPSAQSSWDGMGNSNAIYNTLVGSGSQCTSYCSPFERCLNSTNGGFSDWYLPSIDELGLLWHNRFIVNKALSGISGSNQIGSNLPGYNHGNFWSSTEYSNNRAFVFDFSEGSDNSEDKGVFQNPSSYNIVRAVRAF